MSVTVYKLNTKKEVQYTITSADDQVHDGAVTIRGRLPGHGQIVQAQDVYGRKSLARVVEVNEHGVPITLQFLDTGKIREAIDLILEIAGLFVRLWLIVKGIFSKN